MSPAREPAFAPLAFLRSVAPLPGGLVPDTDAAVVLARLQELHEAGRLEEAGDPGWAVHQLELVRWANHALERLSRGAIEYHDASLHRPLADLLDELAEEAADLGAWGALAQHALDGCGDIEPDARELLAATLRDVAGAGAVAWARIAQARDLLGTLGEPSPNGWGQS